MTVVDGLALGVGIGSCNWCLQQLVNFLLQVRRCVFKQSTSANVMVYLATAAESSC